MTNGIDASMKMDLLLADAFMIVKKMKVVKLIVSTSSRHGNLSVLARFTILTPYGQILAFIKENCPAGCPCDGFPCTETTTTTTTTVTTSTAPPTTPAPASNAVLVLSTRNAANKPMVVGWDGKRIIFPDA